MGPLAPGLELDHLCRRRACCLVAHLEPVTRSVNERRKLWRHRLRRKVCFAGHPLFTLGRRTPEGGIICLVCSGLRKSPQMPQELTKP